MRITRPLVQLLAVATLALGATASQAAAQKPTGPAPGARTEPAPPAVSPYYPVSYPGRTILRSARVDTAASTVTLPLHRGHMRDGRVVWFVLTDTSDSRVARAMGLNWSPKLRNAPAAAVRTASMDARGSMVFDAGTVDFSPARSVVPGRAPHYFPPSHAEPGSVGDAAYSPLVRITGGSRTVPAGTVFNSTVVAFDVSAARIEYPRGAVDHSVVLDRVTAISPAARTVTLSTSLGTAAGHPVLFVSLDSSSPLVSALEATTYAPRLAALGFGTDNAPGSSVTPNYVLTNGPTGSDNPQRQGLDSALGDPGGQVLDVFSTVPGVVDGRAYSPMWDLYVSTWTQDAVDHGYRSALHGELEVLGMGARGYVTGLGGGPIAASGLISNCPVLMSF
ncbi:MAG TPA: hypothetical protein VE781_09380 [Kineosporiaceae bacterium]|nr:hypothetical protein [Kineosporiaceae bacterium]